MCGIVGYLGIDDPGLIERMAQRIRHRGPDGMGVYADPEQTFGMAVRRLAIIDLEGGRQPAANEDRSVVVCYNGEIYNFVELREQLQARGHVFRSRSDTEVIAHAYEEWGTDCLQRFNGMFAFALYDVRRGELLLARDRCGQKPLYWWRHGDKLVFASEVKAILECADVPRACNVRAIDPYLALRYVPEPETMFEGIYTLRAGHFMTVRRGAEPRIERYWEIPLGQDGLPTRDEAMLDLLGDGLDKAVGLTLRSDVPVGAYLSAGVDSSLIVALMAKQQSQVRTFTLGFGSPIDESADAARTAELLGTEHEEVPCRAEDLARLPQVVYQMDRPVGDALVVAFDRLAEAASRDLKVVLSGEGADEMFAGYQFHKVIPLAERYHRLMPGLLQRGIGLPLLRAAPVDMLDRFFRFPARLGRSGRDRLVDFLSRYGERNLFANYLALRTLWGLPQRLALYAPQLKQLATESWIPPVRDHGGPFLDRLLKLQYDEWLQDWSLIRQDKNAMAHSLEVRLPFLDHHLVELAFRMPPRLKASLLRDKIVERRLAERLLPREVVRRPKNPFFLPLEEWYHHPAAQEMVRRTLDPARVRQRGYFDPAVVQALRERAEAREFLPVKQVMSLVILELWHEAFIDRQAV
ncbi:MAG: asparagine synthase (glutamine-hydrolyzing) [Planctomycetota bacterium]